MQLSNKASVAASVLLLLVFSALALPFYAFASGQVTPQTVTTTTQCGHVSLQAMIDAAAPGDTVSVPAGTWQAPIHIDKPLTLEGQAWPVIQGDGSGDVIRISAPGVTVRGLVVRGSGASLDREDAGIRSSGANTVIENNRIEDALFGIYLEQAADSIVRSNTIHGMDLPISRRGDGLKIFYSPRTLVENNVMRDTRDALLWYSPYSIVRGNDFAAGRYGLHLMQSDHHVIEENIFRNNSVGVYIMYGVSFELRRNLLADNRGPSGYGVGLKEASDVLLEGNRIVNNRAGVYSDASPLQPNTTVAYRNNLFAYNEIGLEMLPNTQRNRFQDNIFLDNSEQVNVYGGGDLTHNAWAVDGRGNYWSDYAGFDADGDAIGDLPYASKSLFDNLAGSHPKLRLFHLSPASDALDLAAKAFPIFAPQPRMSDPAPLMQPPTVPDTPGLTPPPTALNFAAAAAMVMVAFAILAAGTRRRKRQRHTFSAQSA
ncbi:MAG TPA: nitrous oxide reductase family maturation protein NosD [Chloroflexi bacterium]|nr:nitrous oxide reductase family maturation protein NosD [Chloroflexota bacterium]